MSSAALLSRLYCAPEAAKYSWGSTGRRLTSCRPDGAISGFVGFGRSGAGAARVAGGSGELQLITRPFGAVTLTFLRRDERVHRHRASCGRKALARLRMSTPSRSPRFARRNAARSSRSRPVGPSCPRARPRPASPSRSACRWSAPADRSGGSRCCPRLADTLPRAWRRSVVVDVRDPHARRVWVPVNHPAWSGRVVVLVGGSSESISPTDLASDLGWLTVWVGECSKWSGLAESPVRPVPVVEGLELSEPYLPPYAPGPQPRRRHPVPAAAWVAVQRRLHHPRTPHPHNPPWLPQYPVPQQPGRRLPHRDRPDHPTRIATPRVQPQ